MRLLLDTHIMLWALIAPERLEAEERAIIGDPANEVHVSAASLWEIAIKFPLQRGRAGALPFGAEAAARHCAAAGFLPLPITAPHAAAVERLPPLHADPFDRMLVAQARVEPMHLISHDRLVRAYLA